jgi:peroxiredoxin
MRIFFFAVFYTLFCTASAQTTIFTLKVGDTAPDFQGMDQAGDRIRLIEKLEKGPVVLIFFRGSWCPYCNKHLSKLQDSLSMVLARGASVITVTPQVPEYSEKTIDKTGATFSILHDQGYRIMDSYHVSFHLDQNTIRRYKLRGFNIDRVNGNEDYIMPVPATFVIGTDRKIDYIHFDPNYKNRSSVADILDVL